jgi:hypothetical protein
MNNPADLARSVASQLDTTQWQAANNSGPIRVFSSTELPTPVRGYRTVSEPKADARSVAEFLGTRMLDAFAVLNERFAFAETLVESPWIVRTGFTMPPGFKSREFVHSVVRHIDNGVHFVMYGVVDETDLPAPRDGFIRCPMYLSGQRITPLREFGCRVEHLMIYELGGLVPRWAQNSIFHRGHVDAYVKEWSRLLEHFDNGGAHAAPSLPRTHAR